jgi:hypothetical protein
VSRARKSRGFGGLLGAGIGTLAIGVGAGVLALAAGGCLYMPPPPVAVAPLREGDTSLSLQITADLLSPVRGRSLAGSVGFFPSLRYAISDAQEVVFFPWPAGRFWVCLDDDTRAYHQLSLGGFHPVFARGSQIGQYVRYDFVAARPTDCDDRHCGVLYPDEEVQAMVVGIWLSARGGILGRNVMDVTSGVAGGLSNERYGAVLEPGLLTLLPGDGGSRLQVRWVPELRAAVWAGQ